MDSLLFQIRSAMLDESESTAGLLRKCILLGADTGSEKLRQWALLELKGYSDQDELPAYRTVSAPLLFMDSISGLTFAQDQTITRIQIPEKARNLVPDSISFYQPLEELEGLAKQDSFRFTNPNLSYAVDIWNQELPPNQQILQLKYIISDTIFQGIIGKIRTSLVELIAELTADSPLEKVPRKESIDSTLELIIRPTQQNITNSITGNNNQIAIGSENRQSNFVQELDNLKDNISKIRLSADKAFDTEDDIEKIYFLVDEVDAAIASPKDIGEEESQSFIRRFCNFVSRTSDTTFQASLSGAAQGIATLMAQGFFT